MDTQHPQPRDTVIDTGPDGPRVNLILPWSALLASVAGVIYSTILIRDLQHGQNATREALIELRTAVVNRSELDLMRERDSNAQVQISDHERRLRDIERRLMNGNSPGGHGR